MPYFTICKYSEWQRMDMFHYWQHVSTEEPEISSGTIVVSETDSAAKSHKPGRQSEQRDRSMKVEKVKLLKNSELWKTICTGFSKNISISFCVDMSKRRRETRQSPFKVPDSNSIFLQSIHEKADRKEVGVCMYVLSTDVYVLLQTLHVMCVTRWLQKRTKITAL